MTPTEVITSARESYNAVGDTFWSDSELLSYMYFASLDLSQRALPIERTFTTTTVSGTQEYAYPTNAISIKRITYDGEKLSPISFGEDDAITAMDADTTDTGKPAYYIIWNDTIILRPIPDDTKTLKVYAYVEPAAIVTTSTLEIPTLWHPALVSYLIYRMTLKDQNQMLASQHKQDYEDYVLKAKRWWRRRKRGDRFGVVKNEDAYSVTLLGAV
jgi:hypothetical protein